MVVLVVVGGWWVVGRLEAFGSVWVLLGTFGGIWKRMDASGKRLQAFSNAQHNAYETYTLNALPVQMLGQDSQKCPFRSRGVDFLAPFLDIFLDQFLDPFWGRFWTVF